MLRNSRLSRDVRFLCDRPPPGISCTPRQEDILDVLDAQVIGLEGTPFEGGIFQLEIKIPDKYPFDPPHVQFKTPVYHPNVDVSGRICLDLLKLPPKGSWSPVVSLAGMLVSVQLLLATPNPDDPLMSEIAEEYLYNRPEYERKAREWTKQHASLSFKEEGSKIKDENTNTKKRKSESSEDNDRESKQKCV